MTLNTAMLDIDGQEEGWSVSSSKGYPLRRHLLS